MNKVGIKHSLHICFLTPKFSLLSRTFDFGFLWPIIQRLTQQGNQVTVLTTKSLLGKSEVERNGVNIYYLFDGDKKIKGVSFAKSALFKFKEIHQTNPIDIFHSFDPAGVLIAEQKLKLKFSAVFDVQATKLSRVTSLLGLVDDSVTSQISTGIKVSFEFLKNYFAQDRFVLANADALIVTSPQQRLFLERYYLYPDHHVYTIPYGVDLGNLEKRKANEALLEKLNLPINSKVIVTINDMTQMEEIRNLIKAFEIVATKKSNARLVIVGHGPKFKEIEYEILCHALGSRVILPGNVPNSEISDYINLADIFINLSVRTSGFEPSILEAMAHGKLVIGSEVSPVSAIIEDGVNGYLLRPADISSLSRLLFRLVSDKINTFDIRENAQKRVRGLFDMDKMVSTLYRAYLRIQLYSKSKWQNPDQITKGS